MKARRDTLLLTRFETNQIQCQHYRITDHIGRVNTFVTHLYPSGSMLRTIVIKRGRHGLALIRHLRIVVTCFSRDLSREQRFAIAGSRISPQVKKSRSSLEP